LRKFIKGYVLSETIERQGLIHVYSGPGKGKTTASLGLALRACGHGWTVLMICFMKGDPNYGEVKSAKEINNFTIVQSGLPTFVKKGDPSEKDKNLAKEGLLLAQSALRKNTHDLLILDEINVAVDYGLIGLEDVLQLINMKPKEMELVLTGRSAHPEIVRKADIVSEILMVKHPFEKGITNREGIDF